MSVVPVHPLDVQPEPSEATATVGTSRRTFGHQLPSRRTFGHNLPSRRTFGHNLPSRRTFGHNLP